MQYRKSVNRCLRFLFSRPVVPILLRVGSGKVIFAVIVGEPKASKHESSELFNANPETNPVSPSLR